MSLIERNCKVCNSSDKSSYLEVVDYTVTKEKFQIKKCNQCSFIFTDPIPSVQNIDKYYQSNEYISHTNSAKGFTNKLYQLVRNYTIIQKIKLIKSINSNNKGSVLDVGCGTGNFIYKAKLTNWTVEGSEPDFSARTKAISLVGKQIKESIFDFKEQQFDIITLWHVLEHIYDLNESLEKLKSLLNKNGNILVAVPNFESKDAEWYGKYWAAYDVPRHLYHFSKKSLSTLLKNHNLVIKKMIPMFFDSFYVSLMSERYKGNNSTIIAYFNAMKMGIISNKEKTNTSSILYIIGHK